MALAEPKSTYPRETGYSRCPSGRGSGLSVPRLWIPIIWSGIANLLEGLGYGVARPWDSVWVWLLGIGFWIIGSLIWISLVKWLSRRLGL